MNDCATSREIAEREKPIERSSLAVTTPRRASARRCIRASFSERMPSPYWGRRSVSKTLLTLEGLSRIAAQTLPSVRDQAVPTRFDMWMSGSPNPFASGVTPVIEKPHFR